MIKIYGIKYQQDSFMKFFSIVIDYVLKKLQAEKK